MATGWFGPAVGVVGLWLFAALMWSPVVGSAQLRPLLARWPTGRLWLNYPLLVALGVAGEAAVFLVPVAVGGSLGGVALVQWTLAVAVGYPLVVAVVVATVAPRVADWSPAATSGIDGRIVVGLTAVLYGVATAAVAGLVFLGLMAYYFPG